MVVLKKNIIFILLILNCSILFSQDFSDEWESHFAYVDFVDVKAFDTKIYVASSNTIFVHDTKTNSNEEYTTVEGLSGQDISSLLYSSEKKLIVIGYKNGLLEVIDEVSGNVTTVVDILNRPGIPPSAIKINDLTEDGDLLYIATGFGVIEYDLTTNLFKDTYLISNSLAVVSDVRSLTVFGDFIFASIEGRGTFVGNKRDFNLIDFSNWNQIQNEVFNEIEIFSGQIIAHTGKTSIYRFNGVAFVENFTRKANINDFEVVGRRLTITFRDEIEVLMPDFSTELQLNFSTNPLLLGNIDYSILLNDELYYTNSGQGFFKTVSQNFENSVVVSPSGPALNNIFRLDVFDKDLWGVYGAIQSFFQPINTRVGPSRLRDDKWINLPFERFNINSTLRGNAVFSDVKINRQDKNQVFVGSFRGGGIYEINDAEEISLFNDTNSNIKPRVLRPSFISAFTFNFDSNNDLWFFNGEVREGSIKKFKMDVNAIGPDDSITIPESFIESSDNISRYNARELLFDENDNLYIASLSSGVLGYQRSTNTVKSLNAEDLDFGFVVSTSLAIDLEGDMWLGTTSGLRLIENPEQMFNEGSETRGEPIIVLENGVPRELFFQQSISDIKVDASNNKWIATGGGVFYLSPDGQEVLLNFTQDNSPLPSNSVNDIAIDESTGSVYFATTKGLVEFNAGQVVAQENFDQFKIFPNPVRPENKNTDVRIQGLTPGANVKITDVVGNLVFEIQNETFNGQSSGEVRWNTKSFNGKEVTSGVYLVLVTGSEGIKTTTGKLLIVR